jgi:predicted N-acetyltransferase YhbS
MQIDYLANHGHHLGELAKWQHAQFGYLNLSVTLEDRVGRLQHALQTNQLPISLVALSDDEQLVGAASILSATITHKHLTPWLSSVVVAPEHRGKGIASALSLRALDEAARIGFETLYLFTPRNESLYARLGWRLIERSDHNDIPLAIMARPTTDQNS